MVWFDIGCLYWMPVLGVGGSGVGGRGLGRLGRGKFSHGITRDFTGFLTWGGREVLAFMLSGIFFLKFYVFYF